MNFLIDGRHAKTIFGGIRQFIKGFNIGNVKRKLLSIGQRDRAASDSRALASPSTPGIRAATICIR